MANECAKVNDTGHFTIVDTANFDLSGDLFDTADSVLSFVTVGRCDLHGTVIFDFDGGAGFFGQARITEPPLPITSLILSGLILMVWIRGANSEIRRAAR